MKRFISAVLFCSALLVCGSVFVVYRAEASEDDVIMRLLDLPAPPPPNPLMPVTGSPRNEDFYDRERPPADDAPIEDLIAYWTVIASTSSELRYAPVPSPRVKQRILAEIRENPNDAVGVMAMFAGDPDGTRMLMDIYERGGSGGSMTRAELDELKRWLTDNSPYFADDLERKASRYRASGEYVSGHNDLINLATYDWERAKPIVDRAYATGGRVERVGALWALYKRSLADSSISDADRYRDELKAIVEDKNATAAMRDLALDALVAEKDWPGRDDWYFSLLEDETLHELRVDGSVFTGLTTIILNSPVEKYKDRMIELAARDNPVVRRAAIRNLGTLLARTNDEKIVKALLPWLMDRNWAPDSVETSRSALIRQLSHMKIAESVPGLIHLLFEKPPREEIEARARLNVELGYSNTNSVSVAANAPRMPVNAAVNAAINAARSAANAAISAAEEDHYPHRYSAIMALQKQADMRAVPALRRVMAQSSDWERGLAIKAIVDSGGFTTTEIVDGMEAAARGVKYINTAAAIASSAKYASNSPHAYDPVGLTGEEGISVTIGLSAARIEKPSDELVQAAANRIESLERRDPATATAMRQMVLDWKGTAVNTMFLRDVKNGKANSDTILKLLAGRKEIREKQPTDIFDLRTGGSVGIGLAACLLEDVNDMTALLDGDDPQAIMMALACGRLLRIPLEAGRVIPLLKSSNGQLASAAEKYLFAEDSPEARAAVLALHPNTAMITGGTTSISVKPADFESSDWLLKVFATVSPYFSSANYGATAAYEGDVRSVEELVRKEVLDDDKLLGIYSYEDYFVRMYADRAVFSVQEDTARFRERTLTKEEFDGLRTFLTYHDVNDAPPFLSCSTGNCVPRQLLMVGRNGGRRIFVKAEKMPELFKGLDAMFAEFERGKLTLRYEAAKKVPGLEVLFADDEVAVETVWKNGGDTRVFVSNKKVRERVNTEINDEFVRMISVEDSEDTPEEDSKAPFNAHATRERSKAKRRYEGVSWFGLANGALVPGAQRPADVMLPTLPDAHAVPPTIEQWKSAAAGVEVRADEAGLYKIVAGKMTKIGSGEYSYPVISSNGRWALVNKYDPEIYEMMLVRVDLQTNRETTIGLPESGEVQAIVFIPAVNRFLLGSENYSEYEYDETGEFVIDGFARPSFRRDSFMLFNPDTGLAQPAPGEYEPLTHQSFRPLQPAGGRKEFWAAIPDYKADVTTVGIYNAGNFGFRPLLKLPSITFDSLDMWVDGGIVYFAYRGHLLSVPLPNN